MKKFLALLLLTYCWIAGTANAQTSQIFGSTGTAPFGVIVDSARNVYTANFNSNNVTKITPGGVSSILGTTGANPRLLRMDSAGNIYVTNQLADTVSKITPAGVSSILGTTGVQPIDIVLDSAGNVYTTNFTASNITKITPAGASSVFATTGFGPAGIVMDASGNIYTANVSSNTVSKITPAGVSSILGTTGSSPIAITIDPAGNIYTANFGSNNVSKITPAGVSSILGTTGSGPIAITIDPDGNIYTANQSSNNVTRITPSGVSSVWGVTGTTPRGIAIDSSGNIYTANFSSNNVTIIIAPERPDGPPVEPPVFISSISPSSGPVAGGNSVVIRGDGFRNASLVSFDNIAATFTVNSSTQITATAPPHAAGAVVLSVRGNGSADAIYTYDAGPNAPQLSQDGIRNNASYVGGATPLALGSIAAIFGTKLTDGTSCVAASGCAQTFDSAGRLNTTLAGAQVKINGAAVPIFYATPTQLGVQIPTDLPGSTASVSVTVGGQTSASQIFSVLPFSPGIFTTNQQGSGPGAITHTDGSAVTTANPARRGETIVLYATGLGPTTPAVATGAKPSGLTTTQVLPTVTIDGLPAVVQFSGASTCCVGLNQVNVVVPGNARPGDVSVVLTIAGRQSNMVTIAVQ